MSFAAARAFLSRPGGGSMLSARAYSFRQKSKLAISLSWIGGYTNVILFLTCGSFVSHMTGNSTQFGAALGEWNLRLLAHFGLLLGCFGLGACSSAIMTESAQRRGMRSKYILPMAAEGLLLGCLMLLLQYQMASGRHDHAIMLALSLLAAFTLGLQNATITEISGIIRTTHVTGVITDIGLEGIRYLDWYLDRTRGRMWQRSGRVLRISQRHPTAQRLGLLLCVFICFVLGAAAGTCVHIHARSVEMLPPVFCVIAIILMDWRKPIAGVEELDLLRDPELRAQGIVKALLPRELGLYRLMHHRRDRLHRPPDFQQWSTHLPDHWRVIILALSPLTRFDENSAMVLREVIEDLRRRRRALVISGITPTQYRALAAGGLLETTDAENLCPDLEFAIARGIDLLRELGLRQPEDEAVLAGV